MKHSILFILILVYGVIANAQIPKENLAVDSGVFPQEKAKIAINSDILLAGELLQYKGFVLNKFNKPSDLSKIMYVSLRNDEDSIVFKHKLKIEEGAANGDFFIPSSLKTGIYTLIGYTNFSRNNSENSFAQKNISILNTFVKTAIKNTASVDTVHLKTLLNNVPKEEVSTLIEITTDKKTYGHREKVNLNIVGALGSLEGNYILSVRKVNPVEVSGSLTKAKDSSFTKIFFIPELRGELISGVVYSKIDDKPVANKIVSLTIPGKDYVFKLAKTNAQGRFFFSASEAYEAQESIIQLDENEGNASSFSLSLSLDNTNFHLQKRTTRVLELDSNLKNWLEERSVQLQIENAYFDVKKDSILGTKINPAFYDNLGTLFLLDDYTRFSSVRETFVEVISLAAIRGSGNNTRFLVNNAYDPNRLAKFNDLPPLVLMDGMMVQDNNDVLGFNAREIKGIRVVPQAYRYGPKIYSGIIAIETKSGDFIPRLTNDYIEKIDLPPTVKEKQNYRPDYSENLLSRIPDYRVQLYWQPNILLADKTYTTSFYTSDVTGTYEILLQGYSDDGKYIFVEKHIAIAEKP